VIEVCRRIERPARSAFMNIKPDPDKQMQQFFRYVEDHGVQYIQELQSLLREPSIISNTIGMTSTAALIEQIMLRMGCQVRQVVTGDSKPYLYGEVGTGPFTILFYNHYDVQPVEPLNEWDFGPFSAEIHDGYIYARGAADNKGNLYATLAAVETYRKVLGELPFRVKFIFEGEEELGSYSMERLAREEEEIFQADQCIWGSGVLDYNGRPYISFGLKGLAYFEVRCSTLRCDVHSAMAAIIDSPVWRLLSALTSLRDVRGGITIDGLDAHVKSVSTEDRDILDQSEFDVNCYRELYGIGKFLHSDDPRELMERVFFSPSVNICGIHAGYTKGGTKTIMPREAWANLDLRLVPNLTPELVMELLRNHLDRHGFQDVELRLKCAIPGYRHQPTAEHLDRIRQASVEAFHAEPYFLPMLAASGPMYHVCAPHRLPVLSFGVAHQGSHIHAPNENIRVHDFIQGIKFIGRLINLFGCPPRHDG
jgi:acetylornithine deacetylase/succinyl-diaminopimelate desuccinylase-like protein